jgi:hypothetical protein
MLKSFNNCKFLLRDFIPIEKIVWSSICYNVNAIPLIDRLWDTIQDKINWSDLCYNPNAIPLIDRYWDTIQHKIHWANLCRNVNAIPFLDKRRDTIQEKLNWSTISRNPNIFVDEYIAVCKNYFKKEISEELMKVVWHPNNFH